MDGRGAVISRRLLSLRLALLASLCAVLLGSGSILPRPAPAAALSPAVVLGPTAVLGWSPGVGRNVPLAAPLTVYFNRAMDRASVQRAWSIWPAASGSFRWNGAAVSFRPSRPLRPGATYRLSIGTLARSTTGVPLSAPFTVQFSTGDALRVLTYTPANGTRGVAASGLISITFNHPMVPLAGLGAAPANPRGWSLSISPHVAGHGSWLGTSTWVFHPDSTLAPSSGYTVTLSPGVQDAWGQPLGRTVRWSFHTLTPEVVSRSPRNGSSYVDPRTTISVTFNQPMDHASTASALTVSVGGARIPGSVTWSGTTLVFHPASPLTSGHAYSVTLGASARSANGHATLGKVVRWQFQSSPSPKITGTDPEQKATTYAQGTGVGYGPYCCYPYHVAIDFNAPMSKSSLDTHLSISPAVPRFTTTFYGPDQYGNFVYTIAGDFKPSSSYTITLASGVQDRFGRPLSDPFTYTFKTSRLYPSVALYGMPGEQGISFSSGQKESVPIQLVNVPKVTYTLVRTNLYGIASSNGRMPSGTRVRHWTETVPDTLNSVQNRHVSLVTGDGSPLPPGLYWLDAKAPDTVPGWPALQYPPESGELVVVSNVSVTVKRGSNGVLVWVNSDQTGKPLSGVAVRLTDGQGVTLTTGRTNAQGLHLFTRYGSNGRVYAAVVADGTHYSMAAVYWQPGMSSPGYLPAFWQDIYGGSSPSSGTYLYTDRPVYRPGQQVHFRGVLWRDRDGVYSLVGPRKAIVQAVDPYGHVLRRATVTLDRYGAVHGSFTLPANTLTGSDIVYVNILHSLGVSAPFTVAEYRKPEFLTSVSSPASSYAQGQTVHATATVKYVFGAPVTHQHVSWIAYAQPQYPHPTGWDDYSFLDWEALWQEDVNPQSGNGSQFGAKVASGSGTTDGNGRLTIAFSLKLTQASLDETLTIEATATDVNHQSVSGRLALSAYNAALLLGLNAEHATQPVGQPQTIDVAAVKHDGTPVPNLAVTATIYRRTYSSQLVQRAGGGTDWQAVPHDTVVTAQSLTTDSNGKATVTFTPAEGGEYYIVVEGKDALGNTARNGISVYASAAGFTDWGLSNDTSINLKADRSSYGVGDTAHIAVPAPFDNATALITVERGTIRSERVEHLASNSSTLDIPITLDDLPNVYVTVTLYRGWRDGSPPDWRYGMTELHVRVDTRHLIVHLKQNGYRHHPGDTVTYAVTTTDAAAHPVSAQLSLALVDSAVLALQDQRNPDILQALYSERPLGVSTASDGVLSIDHLTQQPDFQITPPGGAYSYGGNVPVAAAPQRPKTGGGGGGPPQAVTVRARFADTAYWRGSLVTDASGHGTVRLRLPDNATTWRLDARGVTASQGVGQGSLNTLATQDLVLRPVLPRFLVEGDRLQVGTVLNNNLAQAVGARVTISARGLQLSPGAARTVQVPAHGEQMLLWTVGVPEGAAARITLNATPLTTGVRGDAVQVTVPVHPPLTDETVATSGQVYGSMKQMVIVPRNAVPMPGALTVQVSSSLTAGLGAAYGEFKARLDESNDDVASRLLVASSLRAIPQPVTGISPAAYRGLPRTIALAVQKLLDRQYGDGGWPWFPSPYVYQSDPFVTADAVQALALSGARGAQVRQAMARARTYLQSQLPTMPAAERAHLLLVLARSGPAPRTGAESLYNDSIRRSHLDAAPLADLGMTLSLARDAAKARTVVSALDSSAKVSAAGAHWETSGWELWAGPPVADTAEVLSTLLALSPHDPSVPAAVRWLMLARQGDGWDCQRDTAQTIAALAAYARAAQEGSAAYQYRVALNGGVKLSGGYAPSTVRHVASFRAPVSYLRRANANPLVIDRTAPDGTFGTGPLYYLARLRYYLPARAIAARSEGIAVSRRYLTMSGTPVTQVAAGSVLKVELTIHSAGSLTYLNVQDPLPAGCEPIDESLKTSQQGLFGPPPGWVPFGPTADLSPFLMHTDLHDNRVSLYAYYLPPGTFHYTYLVQATVPGQYGVPPTHVSETFFPEVFGRSAGADLKVS